MAVTIGETTSTATTPAASVRGTGTRTPISRRTTNANKSSVRAAPMTSADRTERSWGGQALARSSTITVGVLDFIQLMA